MKRTFTKYPSRYVKANTEATNIVWTSKDGNWEVEEVDLGDGKTSYTLYDDGKRCGTTDNLLKAMRIANMSSRRKLVATDEVDIDKPTDEEAELLGTDGNLEIWKPITFEGSVKLGNLGGEKADWATCHEKGESYFKNYTNKGTLYVLVNPSNPNEKYQFWDGDDGRAMFADIKDVVWDVNKINDFFEEHPQAAELVGYEI